jgi:hypothetical protein
MTKMLFGKIVGLLCVLNTVHAAAPAYGDTTAFEQALQAWEALTFDVAFGVNFGDSNGTVFTFEANVSTGTLGMPASTILGSFCAAPFGAIISASWMERTFTGSVQPSPLPLQLGLLSNSAPSSLPSHHLPFVHVAAPPVCTHACCHCRNSQWQTSWKAQAFQSGVSLVTVLSYRLELPQYTGCFPCGLLSRHGQRTHAARSGRLGAVGGPHTLCGDIIALMQRCPPVLQRMLHTHRTPPPPCRLRLQLLCAHAHLTLVH